MTDSLPALQLAAPTGASTASVRAVVSSASPDDTVADLAAALGVDVAELRIDGAAAAPAARLVDVTGLRTGARVEGGGGAPPVPWCLPARQGSDQSGQSGLSDQSDQSGRPGQPTAEADHEFAIATGVDCRGWHRLTGGHHIVGRAGGCDIVIADPSIEPFHTLLDVSRTGAPDAVRVVPLGGRAEASPESTAASTPTSTTASVRLGRTRLVVRAAHQSAPAAARRASAESPASNRVIPAPGDPWRRQLVRGQSTGAPQLAPAAPPRTELLPGWPSSTPLVGAGAAVAGAGLIAGLIGQPRLALFALVGAFIGVATWAAGVASAARSRRRTRARNATERLRFDADLAHAVARFRSVHRHQHPPLTDTLSAVDELASQLTALPVEARAAPEVSGACSTGLWSGHANDGLGTVVAIGAVRAPIEALVSADRSAFGTPDTSIDTSAVHAAEQQPELGVVVPLQAGTTVAVRGDGAAAVVRGMVIDITSRFGPAHVSVIAVVTEPSAWRWLEWLPHGTARFGTPTVIAAQEFTDDSSAIAVPTTPDGSSAHLVIAITDDLDALAVRAGPLRRVTARPDVVTIAFSEDRGAAPAGTSASVDIASGGACTVTHHHDALRAERGDITGISVATAEQAARTLAVLIDPEDITTTSGLPASLSLRDLFDDDAADPFDPAAVLSRWRTSAPPAPGSAGGRPIAPIGRASGGRVDIDLSADGPHGLIAGTTGSGKSELLRTLVVSLALHHSPDDLNFVLVDYKGGATFDACVDLPHTVGLVTDLDDGLAARALVSLDAELHRREHALRAVGATDLVHYRSMRAGRRDELPPLARLAVVIDEFASLARDVPTFLTALVDVAQRGRSLGVHLLLATQRPAGVVNDDIRANTNLRLALRVHDRSDSVDVLDHPAAAALPSGVPGRALLRLGPDNLLELQVASCTGPARPAQRSLSVTWPDAAATCEASDAAHSSDAATGSDVDGPSELEVAVAAIRAAHERLGGAAPHRPWLEPVPGIVTIDDVMGDDVTGDDVTGAVCVGLVDDPARQRRVPLRWDPAAGNLALAGEIGSGTTTSLVTLVSELCRRHTPASAHLYVLDARGDSALERLEQYPHVGGVVRLADAERTRRLLLRCRDALDARQADPSATADAPLVVIAIDGIGAVRTELSGYDALELNEAFERLLSEGPAARIVTAFTCDPAELLPATLTPSTRWDFVGPHHPGRLRAACGRTAQLAIGTAAERDAAERDAVEGDVVVADAGAPGGGPRPITTLPKRIALEDVLAASGCDRADGLVVGLDADRLEPARLQVPAGDHVVVLGTARCGVSTALDTLAAAWSASHPHGVVHRPHTTAALVELLDELELVSPERRRERPQLVVVDDAGRVEEPSGRFAALLASRSGDVTVVAGSRIDAVRGAYGHWIRTAAQSRCGIVLTSIGDVDADLLGVSLPRRCPLPARPGLGWVIDGGGVRLAQLAVPE